MIITKENVSQLLSMINAKPTKDLGQNFLVEPSVCEKIIGFCGFKESDNVLEIGPGLGSLTHYISSKNKNLTCVDIDPNMIFILKDIYKESNINFVEKDILKYDVSKHKIIVGNLPYNITTDLVVKLLLKGTKCKRYILMIQAEAFNRFNDLSGKEYGPASILVHLLGDIKKLLIVKPGSFYPAPRCNSLVFSIEAKADVDREYVESVYKMSKQLFLNRRKTILNNLSSLVGKEKANSVLTKLNILPNKRPEELSVQNFEEIFKLIK